MRPVLENSSSVWDPSGKGLQEVLKKVQNRAARFVQVITAITALKLGVWMAFWNTWNRNLSRKGGETAGSVMLLYKDLKGKASIPTDDFIPLVRIAWLIILWQFRSQLLTLIFISVASFPRLLETRMHFHTLCWWKAQRIVLLSSPLWWKLGTNLPGHGEWLSFGCDTSKRIWFWGLSLLIVHS